MDNGDMGREKKERGRAGPRTYLCGCHRAVKMTSSCPMQQGGGQAGTLLSQVGGGPRWTGKNFYGTKAGAELKELFSFAEGRGKGIPGQDTVGTNEQGFERRATLLSLSPY